MERRHGGGSQQVAVIGSYAFAFWRLSWSCSDVRWEEATASWARVQEAIETHDAPTSAKQISEMSRAGKIDFIVSETQPE